MSDTIVVGRQGRIVIPAHLRDELGLHAGETVRVVRDGRRLVIERPDDAVSDLRGVLSAATQGRSLVEELLAERRAEVDDGAR
ncbi:AbrB/MazE/SpoVT family DNA-binding domain-containing protein [uncultured Williamsia sp.]|uniref:AbrB/MazE/SpoVT family DNA-binding domain-containing protein n=1 Tax=uncultured Williamsia sp. TaxID=259311 RepID=UPI00260BE127|nr:AbrB/MazE/SpoVT family DNA-binding domain-containing protein [uncultured Williamsia sp.]